MLPGMIGNQGVWIPSVKAVVGTPAGISLTLSATSRSMNGYAPNGRSGWTLGTLTPSSYDDGFAGPYTSVMPVGTNFYFNNVAYNQYYVSSNGYLNFGSGSGLINSAPTAPAGFYLLPGDNYWAANGANVNAVNTPSGFAYKFGTTSNGWYFFSANMMAYAFNAPGNDRGWELNCFWNATNTEQYAEFIYSPALSSTGTPGVYTTVPISGSTASLGVSNAWYSTDKGVTWTQAGSGSWGGVGTF